MALSHAKRIFVQWKNMVITLSRKRVITLSRKKGMEENIQPTEEDKYKRKTTKQAGEKKNKRGKRDDNKAIVDQNKIHTITKKSSGFMCQICVECKPEDQSFNVKDCSHSYCSDCMVRYVASKIRKNIAEITCPEQNCTGVLEPELCRSILPSAVLEKWCSALAESSILSCRKLYCPFKDCSAPLLLDNGCIPVESECPHCRKVFCGQCMAPWHSGILCKEFLKLDENERGRNDILMIQLAMEQKWKRCTKCKFYVSKIEGCNNMKCRCGNYFCYHCVCNPCNKTCNRR